VTGVRRASSVFHNMGAGDQRSHREIKGGNFSPSPPREEDGLEQEFADLGSRI
jgi:hypothetical protein